MHIGNEATAQLRAASEDLSDFGADLRKHILQSETGAQLKPIVSLGRDIKTSFELKSEAVSNGTSSYVVVRLDYKQPRLMELSSGLCVDNRVRGHEISSYGQPCFGRDRNLYVPIVVDNKEYIQNIHTGKLQRCGEDNKLIAGRDGRLYVQAKGEHGILEVTSGELLSTPWAAASISPSKGDKLFAVVQPQVDEESEGVLSILFDVRTGNVIDSIEGRKIKDVFDLKSDASGQTFALVDAEEEVRDENGDLTTVDGIALINLTESRFVKRIEGARITLSETYVGSKVSFSERNLLTLGEDGSVYALGMYRNDAGSNHRLYNLSRNCEVVKMPFMPLEAENIPVKITRGEFVMANIVENGGHAEQLIKTSNGQILREAGDRKIAWVQSDLWSAADGTGYLIGVMQTKKHPYPTHLVKLGKRSSEVIDYAVDPVSGKRTRINSCEGLMASSNGGVYAVVETGRDKLELFDAQRKEIIQLQKGCKLLPTVYHLKRGANGEVLVAIQNAEGEAFLCEIVEPE